ncbi:hypothetical protein TNCV_4852931 [Trichonephila clavipes]|nr:hypothetical protein TNCV_4852931 [Trichonephila clavipes]
MDLIILSYGYKKRIIPQLVFLFPTSTSRQLKDCDRFIAHQSLSTETVASTEMLTTELDTLKSVKRVSCSQRQSSTLPLADITDLKRFGTSVVITYQLGQEKYVCPK